MKPLNTIVMWWSGGIQGVSWIGYTQRVSRAHTRLIGVVVPVCFSIKCKHKLNDGSFQIYTDTPRVWNFLFWNDSCTNYSNWYPCNLTLFDTGILKLIVVSLLLVKIPIERSQFTMSINVYVWTCGFLEKVSPARGRKMYRYGSWVRFTLSRTP